MTLQLAVRELEHPYGSSLCVGLDVLVCVLDSIDVVGSPLLDEE